MSVSADFVLGEVISSSLSGTGRGEAVLPVMAHGGSILRILYGVSNGDGDGFEVLALPLGATASPDGVAIFRGILVRAAFFAHADMYHRCQVA